MSQRENIHATLDKLALPITDVHPRKGNPRRGDVDAIAESLERNGQYRPVVVNKATGEILAGNHTYAAAKRLGWKHIAATFVDVDEDQAARIVLADNRTGDLGDYDDTLLLDMLKGLDDLTGTGYNSDDLDALLGDTSTTADDIGGDAPIEDIEHNWDVIVHCAGEQEQANFIDRCLAEGLTVRAVM